MVCAKCNIPGNLSGMDTSMGNICLWNLRQGTRMAVTLIDMMVVWHWEVVKEWVTVQSKAWEFLL